MKSAWRRSRSRAQRRRGSGSDGETRRDFRISRRFGADMSRPLEPSLSRKERGRAPSASGTLARPGPRSCAAAAGWPRPGPRRDR